MQTVIKTLGKYKTSGNELVFEVCPFCKNGQHNDKYSFYLNQRSGLFKCQRGKCGAKGNLNQLAKHLNVRIYDDNYITVEHKNYAKPTKKVDPAKKDLYEYFKKRGISEDTVDFAEVKQNNQEIVFDYYDEQNILTFRKYKNFRRRKSNGKAIIRREDNTKDIFYMMNKVEDESEILIITEGEEDCLSLYEIGYNFAVSLPSGASNINKPITNCWNWLNTFKIIIIWTDDDEAGYTAEKEIIKRLGVSKCKVVKHKKNDINETLTTLGRQAIVNIIEDADFLPISEVNSVYDIDIFEDGEEEFHMNSTFESINKSTQGGFRRGEVIVWTGYSFAGKSTILQQESATLIKQGESVCIYSAEMKNKKILKKFYLQCSGSENVAEHESHYFEGNYFLPKRENVDKIQSWLGNNFYLIADTFDSEKIDIFSVFEQLIYQKNVQNFIIDNLLTVVVQNQNLLYNQTEFLKKSQFFAKKHNVTIHIVAHQRKLSEEHKKRYRPTIDGITGSSNIRNLIDVCIGIARVPSTMKKENEKIVHDAEILILKERDSGVEGFGGTLLFDKKSLRFIENWNDINYELGWEAL